jgi:hypothetical protein
MARHTLRNLSREAVGRARERGLGGIGVNR